MFEEYKQKEQTNNPNGAPQGYPPAEFDLDVNSVGELIKRRDELLGNTEQAYLADMNAVGTQRNKWLDEDKNSPHTIQQLEAELSKSPEHVTNAALRGHNVFNSILGAVSSKAAEFITGPDVRVWQRVQESTAALGADSLTVKREMESASSDAVRTAMKIALDSRVWQRVQESTAALGADSLTVKREMESASSDAVRTAMKIALDSRVWQRVQESTAALGADSFTVKKNIEAASSTKLREIFKRLVQENIYAQPTSHSGYDGMFNSDAFRRGFSQSSQGRSSSGARGEGRQQRQAPPPRSQNHANSTERPAHETVIDQKVAELRQQGLSDTKIAMRLARQYHPDRQGGSEEAMKYVNNLLAKQPLRTR